MPYTKCPTCGVVSHDRVTDPSTWYQERYPDLPFGSIVPIVCYFCFEELSLGSSVVIRSNFTDQPDWAKPGTRGTVERVVAADDGVLFVVQFDNGLASYFLRGEIRRPNSKESAKPEQERITPKKQADFDGLENRTPQKTPQQVLDVLKQHLDPPKLAELAALLQQHLD
jgi:hypothetical protein